MLFFTCLAALVIWYLRFICQWAAWLVVVSVSVAIVCGLAVGVVVQSAPFYMSEAAGLERCSGVVLLVLLLCAALATVRRKRMV